MTPDDATPDPPEPQTQPSRRQLEAVYLKEITVRLEQRIAARFPRRNLRAVAQDLVVLVDETLADLDQQHRRMKWARMASLVVIVALVVAGVVAIWLLVQGARDGIGGASTWPSFFESLINDLVFASIAIYFTWAWPQRIFRSGTLRALHRLRSIAHVIDMHQLTKDPERLRPDFQPTAASIAEDLTAAQLSYYLDYCSELLSVVSKISALYGEQTSDSTVLAAIEGIEDLTTGMSRKIWQKIALLPQNR
ncbi:hypothetical protein ACQCX5_09760 [Propionibacteriaceae bacterium G57]|uniref:hypothetical protein n=1 Tax=Aestuariimicrobium sp. G57 TaxID=3418485 RepID=UPI003DA7A0AC